MLTACRDDDGRDADGANAGIAFGWTEERFAVIGSDAGALDQEGAS